MLADGRLQAGPRVGRGGSVTRESIEQRTGMMSGVLLDLTRLSVTALFFLNCLVRARDGCLSRAIETAYSFEITRRDEARRAPSLPTPSVVFHAREGEELQALDEACQIL